MKPDNCTYPLVSVVIPVYNSESFVADAINSVLNQDYANLEVIAIDDGSRDASPEILSEFGANIQVIQQDNGGSAKARNAGMNAASGEYIAFLDADDLWHSGKIRRQIDHLRHREDIGLVYNNWLVICEDSEVELEHFFKQKFDTEAIRVVDQLSGWLYTILLLDCAVHTSSAMIRKSVITRVGGFDESLKKGQDYDYWIRLSRQTQFDKLADTLSIYRIHSRGITKQPSPINYAACVVNNALDQWGRVGPDGRSVSAVSIRRRLARIWLDFSSLHLNSGSFQIARESMGKSIRYAPWDVNCWKQYIKSLVASAIS